MRHCRICTHNFIGDARVSRTSPASDKQAVRIFGVEVEGVERVVELQARARKWRRHEGSIRHCAAAEGVLLGQILEREERYILDAQRAQCASSQLEKGG